MDKVIIFTHNKFGSVSQRVPSERCLRFLCMGGRWPHMPRGFVDTQIDRQIAEGRDADASARFSRALAFGGLTTAEAVGVIRDRDCLHLGRHIEIYDRSEMPRDKWFRDAWSRSHNGGPIGIDIDKARLIQWKRAREAVADENRRREEAFEARALIDAPWDTLRSAMRHARDEDELAGVWPDGVARFGRDCNGFEMSAPSAKLRERFNKGAPQ